MKKESQPILDYNIESEFIYFGSTMISYVDSVMLFDHASDLEFINFLSILLSN